MSPSAKIAGSGDIIPMHVESKVQNASSAMDHTRASTTVISPDTAKQTSKQILQGSKKSKGNYVLIFPSAQIVSVIIK